MPAPLSPETRALVKATVPALEAHGLAITRRMYERLFETAAMRELFNQSHHGETGSQPKALAAAVLAYARHIDDLGPLAGAVERIVHKHVALDIRPEHYPFVADALLGAIGDVLGEAATPEIAAAWGEAYWFLAELLIGREAVMYRDLAGRPGGWTGWRDFTVAAVTPESETIRSFTLLPADDRPVVPHRPGQYLGLRLDLPGQGVLKRNYSVSCAPNARSYRISVKREAGDGTAPGLVSNWLHDRAGPGTVVALAPPSGEFVLEDGAGPVVLVSGGVGLTPLLSMLEASVAASPDRPVWWVHATRDGATHAFGERVRALAAVAPGLHRHVVYEAPRPQDRAGHDHDALGRIDADWLARHTPLAEATLYLCGPRPFLHALAGGLLARGVPATRLRHEFFGPADEVLGEPALAA